MGAEAGPWVIRRGNARESSTNGGGCMLQCYKGFFLLLAESWVGVSRLSCFQGNVTSGLISFMMPSLLAPNMPHRLIALQLDLDRTCNLLS
jgi:hypothetical protein